MKKQFYVCQLRLDTLSKQKEDSEQEVKRLAADLMTAMSSKATVSYILGHYLYTIPRNIPSILIFYVV